MSYLEVCIGAYRKACTEHQKLRQCLADHSATVTTLERQLEDAARLVEEEKTRLLAAIEEGR